MHHKPFLDTRLSFPRGSINDMWGDLLACKGKLGIKGGGPYYDERKGEGKGHYGGKKG